MKRTLRNIIWIALLLVWSFLAGAYANLGWAQTAGHDYMANFMVGCIGMWIVFASMAIIVYRILKKKEHKDPMKMSLLAPTFFTLIFGLFAWIKYDDVVQERAEEIYFDDLEWVFTTFYIEKSKNLDIKIENLDEEIDRMYSCIKVLMSSSTKDSLVKLKDPVAFLQNNTIVGPLCAECIEMHKKIGLSTSEEVTALFVND